MISAFPVVFTHPGRRFKQGRILRFKMLPCYFVLVACYWPSGALPLPLAGSFLVFGLLWTGLSLKPVGMNILDSVTCQPGRPVMTG